MIRKLLHFLIALVPLFAALNKDLALMRLTVGTLVYIVAEKLRLEGVQILFISNITVIASRKRDMGRFVLGPVTLALGAMMALLIYPEPAARIAIYALAFGDGFSSLIGKLVKGIKIPFTRGKTFSGSFACFVSVFLITWRILGSFWKALIIAVSATLLEALPTGDLDNLIIPIGTGLVTSLLIGII
ncbi:MAG: phosphatidate cytidylyltransferase [Spirochaetia bacterium]